MNTRGGEEKIQRNVNQRRSSACSEYTPCRAAVRANLKVHHIARLWVRFGDLQPALLIRKNDFRAGVACPVCPLFAPRHRRPPGRRPLYVLKLYSAVDPLSR